MVPMLSEIWRIAAHRLRPEKAPTAKLSLAGPSASLAGLAKALLWACLPVLAGLALAQLK